ncbi:MAG: ROK family protein, partial [Pseudomonadota bacterium]
MALVLADVGGTNVRFAFVSHGQADPQGTRRYQNDEYALFDDALDAYVADTGLAGIRSLSVAVAGPVTDQTARLTNRNWHLDAADLAQKYHCESVYLLNDLSALGYALDFLHEEDLTPIIQTAPGSGADQRLVIGVGTGFNVSPVLKVGGGSVCLRAEAGLGSLPTRVAGLMQDYLQRPAPWVRCAEDAVRGPGLTELHAAATGGQKLDARDVLSAAEKGDAQALASVTVYARMIGEFAQDLRLLYMPRGGIFFAGSVMRGLLDSPVRDIFIETLNAQPTVKTKLS